MSTERKPGSRGAMDPFAGGRTKPEPRAADEPGTRRNPKTKGSTRTVSPRASFKRRPRK